LLIDSDIQGSLRDWRILNKEKEKYQQLEVISVENPVLEKEIQKYSTYDFILIDGVPRLQDMAISAIKASDFILIPITPSPFDVWSTSDLTDLIKERQKKYPLKAAFVLTKVIPGTKIAKEVMEPLEEYELPILKTSINQRIIYPTSTSEGLTVFDFKGSAAARMAIKEIDSLTHEIINLLNYRS
jgi:chromosome partitioning protein